MNSDLKHFQSSRTAQKCAIANLLSKQILPWEKKLKTCQGRPHLLSDRFIRAFYKTTTCPRRSLLSGTKSGRLLQV